MRQKAITVCNSRQSLHAEQPKQNHKDCLTVYVQTELERESASLLYGYWGNFGKFESTKERRLTLP